jgi:hypothetical protein
MSASLRSRWLSGKIRYQVPPGMEPFWDGKKQFTLGATIGDILDKYAVFVVPQSKSVRTRENKLAAIPLPKKRFGHMRKGEFKPNHAYQYVARRRNAKTGAPAVTAAHRELEVLSHAFTWSVLWVIWIRIRSKRSFASKSHSSRRHATDTLRIGSWPRR